MKKELAEQIIEKTLSLDSELNSIEPIMRRIESEEERKRYLLSLGNLVGLIYTEIMIPIFLEYPELDPEKKKE